MYKTKKAIKRDILERFRSMDDDTEPVINGILLHREYVKKLSTHEKENYVRAIQELAGKGFIRYSGGAIPDLELTPRGADLIYGAALN
jgi:hypothetical protein